MNLKLLQQSFVFAINALGTRIGAEFRSLRSTLQGPTGAAQIGTTGGQTLQQRLDAIGTGGGEGGEGIPAGTLEQIAVDKQAVADNRAAVDIAKGLVDTAKGAVDTAKSAVDITKGQIDTIKSAIDGQVTTINGQAATINTAVTTTLPGLVTQAQQARDAAGIAGATAGSTAGATAGSTAGASAGATAGSTAGATAANSAVSALVASLADIGGASTIGSSTGETVEQRLNAMQQAIDQLVSGGGGGPMARIALFSPGYTMEQPSSSYQIYFSDTLTQNATVTVMFNTVSGTAALSELNVGGIDVLAGPGMEYDLQLTSGSDHIEVTYNLSNGEIGDTLAYTLTFMNKAGETPVFADEGEVVPVDHVVPEVYEISMSASQNVFNYPGGAYDVSINGSLTDDVTVRAWAEVTEGSLGSIMINYNSSGVGPEVPFDLPLTVGTTTLSVQVGDALPSKYNIVFENKDGERAVLPMAGSRVSIEHAE